MSGRTKFNELKRVFERLHGPKGCMWDKKQTHKSLIPYLREESDEFIHALKKGDFSHMKEELGDILLQVMFHSQIASKAGEFDVEDVIDGLVKKLKRRHPHIFGKTKVHSVDDIVANWHRIKAQERKTKRMNMKNIVLAVLILTGICFSGASASGADQARPKVLVMPFDDKTQELKSSEAALTKAAAEAVAASAAYTYVSPDDFANNWLKALTEKDKKLFGPDPAAQMKNLRQYRPLFIHEDLGTLNEFKDRWGVDLAIVGEVRKEGNAMVLYTELVSMDTGRLYAVRDEFRPGEEQELIKQQVAHLFTKGVEVSMVSADMVILPRRSVVAYDILALNGEYIRVVMDYSSNRPDPDLQNVDIVPHRPINDGILQLKAATEGKKQITFQYFYRQGQFVNIKISTDRSKEIQGKEYEEALPVISKGGYKLKFIFKWKDQEVSGVRVEPAVNPYGEVK